MKIIPEMAGPDFRPGLTSEEIEHIRGRTSDRMIFLMTSIISSAYAFMIMFFYLPLEFYLLVNDWNALLYLSLPLLILIGISLVSYILYLRRGLDKLDIIEAKIYVDEIEKN
jgi:hypothetical protein